MINNSIKLNYIYNVSYQILTLIIPLITTPYISRVLGAEGIGLYSFSFSIVSYFVLFATNGTNTYGQREIAYNQNNTFDQAKIFVNVFLFRLFCTAISFAIYFLFINEFRNNYIFLVQGINILSVAADITWYYQGTEHFKEIVVKNIFFKILSVLCIFTFVNEPGDILIYVFINAFTSLVGHLSLWFSIPHFIKNVKKTSLSPLNDWKTILALFIPQIAIQIYTVLDKTMIGLITKSNVENGYYEQGYKIVSICISIVTALGTVMIPRIAYTYACNDFTQLKKYMYQSYRFVWLIGFPMLFGLCAIVDIFVPWFMGPGYEKVPGIIIILSFMILAIGISNVTGMQYLMTTKKQNVLSYTVIIGAIVNFILNFHFISIYKSYGAAISSVIAETIITVFQLFFVRRDFSIKKILESACPYCFASALMFFLLMYIKKFLHANFLSTFIMVCIGVVFYILCLALYRDPFVIAGIKKIYKK